MATKIIYNEKDLIQLQVEALFVHDENGRLLRINEQSNPNPAARFVLSRSKSGNLWRTRYDLPPELTAELERLAASEPVLTVHTEPPHHADEYTRLLQTHMPIVSTFSGPGYYLPTNQPHDSVMITPENLSVVETHFDWLLTELADCSPVAATVVNDEAVAVCFCARITPKVAEAGVYTAETHRGHGYATNAVRGWMEAVRASGRLPLYGTSWDNLASQAIARKVGAVFYVADYNIT
ncbi:MAG: GNAT family N-acetyltransferase [Aggregatilineales bacterium]